MTLKFTFFYKMWLRFEIIEKFVKLFLYRTYNIITVVDF